MRTLTAAPAAPVSPPAVALRALSDERLARWAAKGSQPAFAVIFERHHQALHRYCHSIVGNSHDAADALQNTMLKALRALPGETRTIALKPWLYRIAHNESISLMRARRDHSDLDTAAQLGDPAAPTIAESREQLRDLTADLRELTEQQRGTLLMRELAGLEFDDISAALQISATAAKQSVYEARCALQSLGEGRAMDCDLVRRTLSDGDRRTLRNMKIRGHLRDCAGCRDFETALRHRPAHLAALTPPLPLAAGAAILQGLLGAGAGAGGSGTGGGLLAGLGLSAQTSGALSLGAAKVASVVVIAGSATGGAIYIAPRQPAQLADAPPVMRQSAPSVAQTVAPAAPRERSDKSPARRAPREAGSPTSAPERGGPTSTDKPPATEPRRPGAESAPRPVGPTGRPSLPPGAAAPARGGAPGPVESGDGRATRPPATATAPAGAGYAPPARPAAGAASPTAPAPVAPTAGAPVLAAPVRERAAAPADSTDAAVAPRPR
jgi:RNA polymerase sigma factor (sigma-70 family)